MLPISHACLTVAFPVPTPEASLQVGRKEGNNIGWSHGTTHNLQQQSWIVLAKWHWFDLIHTRSPACRAGVSTYEGSNAFCHGTQCMLKNAENGRIDKFGLQRTCMHFSIAAISSIVRHTYSHQDLIAADTIWAFTHIMVHALPKNSCTRYVVRFKIGLLFLIFICWGIFSMGKWLRSFAGKVLSTNPKDIFAHMIEWARQHVYAMALSALLFDLRQHCTRLGLDKAHILHLSGLRLKGTTHGQEDPSFDERKSAFPSANIRCDWWNASVAIHSAGCGLIVQLILQISQIGIGFDAFQPQGKDDIQWCLCFIWDNRYPI